MPCRLPQMAAAIASTDATGGSGMLAITPWVVRAMNVRRSSMKRRTADAILGLRLVYGRCRLQAWFAGYVVHGAFVVVVFHERGVGGLRDRFLRLIRDWLALSSRFIWSSNQALFIQSTRGPEVNHRRRGSAW